jgi:protein SCO1
MTKAGASTTIIAATSSGRRDRRTGARSIVDRDDTRPTPPPLRGAILTLVSAGTPAADTPPPRPAIVKLALPAIAILVIVGGLTLLLAGGSSKQPLPYHATATKAATYEGLTLTPQRPAPSLGSLRNYNGEAFNPQADRGRAMFVTFLYAHCPDVCPLIAANLHNAYARLAPALRSHVAIVAVSVDPHGDSAGTVAAFVQSHQLSGEASYLIGTAKQLVPVWKAWDVGSEQDTSRPDLVNHSALVYGISASGKLTTVYAANFKPQEIDHDAGVLLGH